MFPPYFYLLFLCPTNPVCQYLIRTGQLFQLFLHGALPDVDFHPFGEHRLLCRFTQRYKLLLLSTPTSLFSASVQKNASGSFPAFAAATDGSRRVCVDFP